MTDQLIVHIRWMIRRDMPEVLRIESECYDFCWCEDDFLRCLRQRNCIGMVAEFDCRVAGFMIYELHKTKFGLLNLAVHPEYQRQGVGAQLIDRMTNKLRYGRRDKLIIDIRETNLAGQLFLKQQGFQAVSVSRCHYNDTGEDAFMFQYTAQRESSDDYAAASLVRRVE